MSARPSPRRKSSGRSRRAEARAGGPQRLQKVLAAAGVASRRESEGYILAGRVEVDHRVVTELGAKVDPDRQEIRVDGVPLRRRQKLYYLINKPPGIVSTNRDPAGRARVIDLVPAGGGRLFTVGRLDKSSDGLILVTNDGELANRLAHPRYAVAKTYRVEVAGHPPPEVLNQLRRGVHLAEGVARARRVRIRTRRKQSTVLEIELTEGRNREIRRMLARTGHKVLRLTRIALGPLRLGELPLGGWRRLKRAEVAAIERAARRRQREKR